MIVCLNLKSYFCGMISRTRRLIRRTVPYFVLTILSHGFLPCAVSFASEAPVSDSRVSVNPADTVFLNEVSVSAMKTDTKLFDSPVASTTLSASELEKLGAVEIKGISDAVPNFFMPDYGSRITSSMYVRGIGARMDQPAVGLNVDNVPILNKDAFDFDIPDIVEVEMLRGPQSTLFGRNTIGGLINISTLSPMRWQGWRLMAEVGNGRSFRASAGWYHRFSSKFGASAVGAFSYSGGFFRNAYDGSLTDTERNGSLRLKQHWNPSGSVTLRNTLFLSLLRQGGYPYEYVGTGEVSYNDTCFYRRFLLTDGLTVSHRGDGFDLTSVSSVQYLNDNMTLDQDFLPIPYFTLTQRKKETSLTEELVVRSSDPDAFWQWLGGVFGFYKHLSMEAPVTFKDMGISSLIESNRNNANPDYPVRWDSREFVLDSDFKMPSWGMSAYHESKFTLGDFRLSLGGRLDYERVSMSYLSSCHTGYDILHRPADNMPESLFRHVDIDIDDTGSLHHDFLTFMPRLALIWNFTGRADGNIYLNISKGYKAGGFNTQMFSDVLQQRLMGIMGIGASYDIDKIVSYLPEKSWNFEVGAHLSVPDSRLTAEAAIFLIECTDQQLTMFPDGTTTGRIMTNAGRTRSFGGELSLRWMPVDNLSVVGSYGYTNARFTRFYNGINDFSGKFLPYVPRNTVFAQVSYSLPLSLSWADALNFDVNLRGAGSIYWNESNSLSQNFYARLGASVSLSARRWSLTLWGRNLTDTRFYTFYFMSMGNEFLQRGKPIQFGATLALRLPSS